jgi:hypothetical protein
MVQRSARVLDVRGSIAPAFGQWRECEQQLRDREKEKRGTPERTGGAHEPHTGCRLRTFHTRVNLKGS